MRLALLVCALVLVAPASAFARKPVISYVDSGVLRLYDSETGADVDPPPAVAAGFLAYSISLNGRYIVFDDATKKLHLLDRATNTQLALPGIDIYTNPGSLSVSDTGRIAFDDGTGRTVVYDSGAHAFITTGLASGNRQPRLSADGRFLATICDDTCVPALGLGPDPYVQDLTVPADTGFTSSAADEEHPCIDGDGSLVGLDSGAAPARDVHIFDRGVSPAADLGLTDLSAPLKDESHCVLDRTGAYIGLTYESATPPFAVYEVSSGTFVDLPAERGFDSGSVFSEPYTPPPGGGPAAPPPSGDRVKPVTSRVRMSHRRFRPGRRATAFTFVLSEPAAVRIVMRRVGRYAGELRRTRLNAGVNTIRWTGRLRGRNVRPGSYAAVVIATDLAGNLSLPVLKEFRVLRPEGDRRP